MHSWPKTWMPPFVSKLAAEDRCHLNGLAMRNGRPAYATTISEGDVPDGWRDHRRNGGCVIDIAKKEIVLTVGPSSITIDNMGITLKAPTVTVQASGPIVVQGLPVKIN